MKNPVPVIVTHPRALIRDGITRLLTSTRFRPVHTAAEFDEAAHNAAPQASGQSHVWLLGMDKFSTPNLDDMRRVSASRPDLTIVVLGECNSPDEALSVLDAGASGFIGYDITRERLIKSLELIVLGEMVVPAQLLRAISTRLSSESFQSEQDLSAPLTMAVSHAVARELTTATDKRLTKDNMYTAPRLSSREISILRLFKEGASNRLIARQLGIAEATVKVHNKAILRKLRLQNRTQAAVWARTHLDGAPNDAPLGNGASHILWGD